MYNENVACGDYVPAKRTERRSAQPDLKASCRRRTDPEAGPDGEDNTNLSDFVFFPSVMQNKEAYECVLSIILDDPDLKLKEVHVEEMIPNKRGKRAVRLDV